MKKEIFRFIIVSGACFVFEIFCLYALTEYAGIYYLWSSAAAFTLTVIINYILCAKWVFTAKKAQSVAVFLIFAGSSIVGLLLNQVCMLVMVEFMRVYYIIAKCIATGIVAVWNFIMKRWALTK